MELLSISTFSIVTRASPPHPSISKKSITNKRKMIDI